VNWLRKDIGLKLVSLLISISLWVYVKSTMLDSTTRTIEFTLYPTNLDSSLVVTRKPETLKVEAHGNPEDISRIAKLKESTFVAYIDLSNAAPGTSQYRVLLQPPPEARQGISYARPDRVFVSVEPLDTTTKKVDYELVTKPSGYDDGPTQVVPETVKLSGPRSALSRVTQVIAAVDVKNYLANPGESYRVDAVPLDASRKRVESVTCDPSQVKVYPVLIQTQRLKNVPIELTWKGTLPFGYTIKSNEANPQQVTISGDPDRIKDIESIETEPIDLSNITGMRDVRVKLKIPQNVKLGRRTPHDVRVRLYVVPAPNVQPPATQESTSSASGH